MKILRLCLLGWLACGLVSAHAASSDKKAAPAAPLFDAAMSRGDVLLAGGDNPGAEKQYRIALQQGPTGEARADALHKLGIALAQQQRFDEAEPLVDSAEQIARVQGNGILLADVLRAKTFILYKTGRVDAARATFREAKNILESASNTWKTDGDGTTWVHIASGQKFPARIGPFNRLRRTILDEAGQSVVVHDRIGERGWGAALASVYVSVDRGVTLAGEFDATANEIIRQYPDAQQILRGGLERAGLSGHQGVFDLSPSPTGKIRQTSLSAFEAGNVLIRIRSSYPAAEAEKRSGQIDGLTRTILSSLTRP